MQLQLHVASLQLRCAEVCLCVVQLLQSTTHSLGRDGVAVHSVVFAGMTVCGAAEGAIPALFVHIRAQVLLLLFLREEVCVVGREKQLEGEAGALGFLAPAHTAVQVRQAVALVHLVDLAQHGLRLLLTALALSMRCKWAAFSAKIGSVGQFRESPHRFLASHGIGSPKYK